MSSLATTDRSRGIDVLAYIEIARIGIAQTAQHLEQPRRWPVRPEQLGNRLQRVCAIAANLQRAHALIESGKARGKVVLEGWA